MKPYLQAFKVFVTRESIQDFIRKECNLQKSHLKQFLKNISIKFDLATRHRRHFLSINCQLICFGKINIFHLSMRELNVNASGEDIADILMSILEEYDISISQIFSITIDNGKNMLKAVKELNDINNSSEIYEESSSDNSEDFF